MREDGFYWVSFYEEWTIGNWDGKDWSLVGSDEIYYDSDLGEVGERIEKR